MRRGRARQPRHAQLALCRRRSSARRRCSRWSPRRPRYAALSKSSELAAVDVRRSHSVTRAGCDDPEHHPHAPSTTTAPATLGTTAHAESGPLGAVKPPKIPLTAVDPKTPSTPRRRRARRARAARPRPRRRLRRRRWSTAAKNRRRRRSCSTPTRRRTYNPYDYPASGFGDPSLAIDGDPTTAWTAQVDPATAPKMAQGLLIDLKTKQKLAAVQADHLDAGDDGPGLRRQQPHRAGVDHRPAWVRAQPLATSRRSTRAIKLRDANRRRSRS